MNSSAYYYNLWVSNEVEITEVEDSGEAQPPPHPPPPNNNDPNSGDINNESIQMEISGEPEVEEVKEYGDIGIRVRTRYFLSDPSTFTQQIETIAYEDEGVEEQENAVPEQVVLIDENAQLKIKEERDGSGDEEFETISHSNFVEVMSAIRDTSPPEEKRRRVEDDGAGDHGAYLDDAYFYPQDGESTAVNDPTPQFEDSNAQSGDIQSSFTESANEVSSLTEIFLTFMFPYVSSRADDYMALDGNEEEVGDYASIEDENSNPIEILDSSSDEFETIPEVHLVGKSHDTNSDFGDEDTGAHTDNNTKVTFSNASDCEGLFIALPGSDSSMKSRCGFRELLRTESVWYCGRCGSCQNLPFLGYCRKCYRARRAWLPSRPKPKPKASLKNVGSRDGKKQPRNKEADSESEEDLDSKCSICMVRDKDAAFVHGNNAHVYCCYTCGQKILKKTGKCPICRRKILRLVKVVQS